MSVESWKARFRAPVSFLPEWSPASPRHAVYASNESGIWQVHALDTETGERRQVTDHPVGLLDGAPTLAGDGVLWFQDETGDESGRWLVQPFHGGETTAVPRGRSARLERRPRPGAGHRRGGDQRRRRVRGLRLAGRRPGEPDPPLVRVRAARRRARRLRARRALGRRQPPLHRARRARRPDPPGAPGPRPANGRDGGRTARRRNVAPRQVLVPGRRRSAARLRARARRRHATRDLEPRDRRGLAARPRARRRGPRARLVARRVGAPAREHVRGQITPLPL